MKFSIAEVMEKQKLFDQLDADLPEFQERGLRIGENLKIIREKRYYLPDYPSFQELLEKRFGFSVRRYQQLAKAVTVKNSLPENLAEKVENERQARALADVPPEARAEVVETASADGPLTSESIQEAAKNVIPVPAKEEPKDHTGHEIPIKLQPVFANPGINKYLHYISELRGFLRRFMETRGLEPQFVEVGSLSSGLDALDTLYAELKRAVPYAVCPDCSGIDGQLQTCLACTGRGWISEFFYFNCTTQEHRNMRKAVVADREKEKARKAA